MVDGGGEGEVAVVSGLVERSLPGGNRPLPQGSELSARNAGSEIFTLP